MKSRRNRKGGGLFDNFFGSKPAQPAQPAQPAPLAQPVPVASQVDVQNALPLGEKELPEALLKEPPAETPSGNATVDKAVSDLYHLGPEFQNYHMRGIINAIGVCNSTEKARNNLTRTFEAIQCGPACKVRSEKVKAALKELLRIGEGNDALGYIGSGRVAVNSAAYVGNSLYSLGNKVGSLLTRKTQATPVAQEGQVSQAGGRRRTRRR
jgi:hypothetical protein